MWNKGRNGYLLIFSALLLAELAIALFVQDSLIRPYVGDVLATLLLCCLSRAVIPKLHPALPVFALSAAVEAWQYLGLTAKLGLSGTALGILLGATADWKDVLCYAIGCLLFAGGEWAGKYIMR